ncbi:MAG TPA: hypothetical protein QF658_02985, partial [Pelagibacteraceae bacterium]|nr:hypothetical protein [Pelagibacteraceae bacterium]
SPKTTLASGHDTAVDARPVNNEIKRQLKINVSLSRKIHIIALPQDIPLKTFWSAAQSCAKPSHPFGNVLRFICYLPSFFHHVLSAFAPRAWLGETFCGI